MNILIISDSHGRRDLVREVIDRTHPDAILFAGDGLRDLPDVDPSCEVYAVRGNCDFVTFADPVDGECPEETLVLLGGIRILLVHGHRYGVKSGLGAAIARAAARQADVLVFGHTHTPVELCIRPDADSSYGTSLEKPLWVFNPGSLGYERSFGTLTIRNGQILFGHGEA